MEGRQGLGGPGKRPQLPPSPDLGRRAMARLSPTPHFPSVRATGPAGRTASAGPPPSGIGVSVAAPPAAYLRPSGRIRGLRDSFPTGPSAQPRRPASHPPPLPAPGTGGGRRGRGRVVECETQRRDSAALSRRRHCALQHSAGLASSSGRAGETHGGRPAGRHCRSPSGRGRAASQQPAARGRVGGRMGRGLGE